MKIMGALLTSLALSACNVDEAEATRTYRDLDAPPDRLRSEEAKKRGRALFLEKCALCHGERADGNGIRIKGLSAKPANFRSHAWRARVRPGHVFRVITEGKRGTSMPAWPTLTDDQKWDLVAYVLGVAEGGP